MVTLYLKKKAPLSTYCKHFEGPNSPKFLVPIFGRKTWKPAQVFRQSIDAMRFGSIPTACIRHNAKEFKYTASWNST